MAIMGWSSATMVKRYQHVLDSIRRDVASQVGGLLWETTRSRHQTTMTTGPPGCAFRPESEANETMNETEWDAGVLGAAGCYGIPPGQRGGG